MNVKESNESYVGGFRLKTYKGGNVVIIILKMKEIFLKNIYFIISFSFYYFQPKKSSHYLYFYLYILNFIHI